MYLVHPPILAALSFGITFLNLIPSKIVIVFS